MSNGARERCIVGKIRVDVDQIEVTGYDRVWFEVHQKSEESGRNALGHCVPFIR